MNLHRSSALLLAAAVTLSCSGGAWADDGVTHIALSDNGVTVEGRAASTDPSAAVYTGGELIYYHDGTDETYGEGTEAEKHSPAEAAAHTVVTITQPGTYRLTGSLSLGQIAVDLGKEAKDDPDAVVTLILDGVDVTSTAAPALIFYNVYECDRAFVAYDNDEDPDYQATPYVDTSAAGANVVIADGSENTFTGSHVARIYKEGTTKKLHKYDGAFYSKMSMNISGGTVGDGLLTIIADNEGLDSELHLTLNGGNIRIESQDDGINTNEDFVSVTTVNGGTLTVNAGLGSEGDGIDSNGYLVLNGGTVWTAANPQTGDGGIDADSPILLNGSTVYAFGSRNDAADTDSQQPYLELSFASTLPAGSQVRLTDEEGNEKMAFTLERPCQSMTLALGGDAPLELDKVYHLYVDGILQCWNGSGSAMGRPGGFGGREEGMEPPEGFRPGQRPPELPDGQLPQGPDGQLPQEQPPVSGQWGPGPFDGEGELPQRPDRPQDLDPDRGGHGFGGGQAADGSGSTDFVLTEENKSFSGVCDSDDSGKQRVTFTVEGTRRVGRRQVLEEVTAITSSVAGLDPSLVQITVTDDPSESYAASCSLADGLEAVNALLPTDKGDYTLTVAVVSGSEDYTGATQLSFTVGALPFLDVREEDPAYDAIQTLYEAGILTGTGETTFSPDLAVTQAQLATALGRLEGVEAGGTADSWYAGYAAWAVESGLMEVNGAGDLDPQEVVTARQLAEILARYDESFHVPEDLTCPVTRAQLAQVLAAGME